MKDLKFIAQQLRKPSGEFAPKIAEKMNEGNKPLYELTINTMEIAENDTILEIGFGNGFHFEDFLSLKKGLQVYGIDYSEEMVDMSMVRNKDFIKSGQLHLTEGSSDRLKFNDVMFDKVFCNMVIYFWENPEEHLKEIYRVLKPGGKFYTGMRTRDSMLELPFTKFGFNLYSVDQWKSILHSHELVVTDIARKKDPVFDDEGNQVRLESVCIAAERFKHQ